MNGSDINKAIPLILCSIDTIAVTGNLILVKSRNTGRSITKPMIYSQKARYNYDTNTSFMQQKL